MKYLRQYNRTKLGKFAQELKDPVLLKGMVERYDYKWISKEAAKRKMSIAALIRYFIKHCKEFLKN